MRYHISPPPNLLERQEIHSGPIRRPGFEKYGVIFTSSENSSPTNLNTADLIGATLENTTNVPLDDDRFFTILGGYYSKRNGDKMDISTLFGIASDTGKGFNLQPGDSCLADEWVMNNQPPDRAHKFVNERLYDGEGWTFIVAFKAFRPLYPCTGKGMDIYWECPELQTLDLSVAEESGTTVSVQCQVSFVGDPAEELVWNWGDGSPEETLPPGPASHAYARQPGADSTHTITVTCKGPGPCSDSLTDQVSITGSCPKLTSLDISETSLTETTMDVSVTAVSESGSPDDYEWDWGDGSPNEKTESPTASHSYARPAGDAESYRLSLASAGPGRCTDSIGTEMKVPGICPVIMLELSSPQLDEDEAHVTAKILVLGPAPESISWDWGDGSPVEKSNETTRNHSYTRDAMSDATFTVSVTSTGPDSCSSASNASVAVQARCPEIALGEPGIEERGKYARVTVALDITGPQPQQYLWTWGDQSAGEVTTVPNASHDYLRPIGDDAQLILSVEGRGPQECVDNASGWVTVPGITPCPTLVEIRHMITEETDSRATVTFYAIYENGNPEQYNWDFGDGSDPVSNTDNTISHEYKLGEAEQSIPIQLKTTGPSDCSAEGSLRVLIPGISAVECPELKEINILYQSSLNREQYEVKAEVLSSGLAPERYLWNWGDGSAPEETESPVAKHAYKRPQTAQDYSFRINSFGPGNCGSQIEGSISVPAEEEKRVHLFCRIHPFLLAFVAALLIALFWTAIHDTRESEGSDTVLWWITGATAAILGGLIYLWGSRGKVNDCPPGKCDWYAIGWTAALSGLAMTFYLINCHIVWIIPASVFFLASAGFLFLWFRACAPTTRAIRFFIYVGLSLVAFFIVAFALANPFLECV